MNDLAVNVKFNDDQIIRKGDDIPEGYVKINLSSNFKENRKEFVDSVELTISYHSSHYPSLEPLKEKKLTEAYIYVPEKYVQKIFNHSYLMIEKEKEDIIQGKLVSHRVDIDHFVKHSKFKRTGFSQDIKMSVNALNDILTGVENRPDILIPSVLRLSGYNRDSGKQTFKGTEEFVKYVQNHGYKKFKGCTFENVDFNEATYALEKIRPVFDYKKMDFEGCTFKNCEMSVHGTKFIDTKRNLIMKEYSQDLQIVLSKDYVKDLVFQKPDNIYDKSKTLVSKSGDLKLKGVTYCQKDKNGDYLLNFSKNGQSSGKEFIPPMSNNLLTQFKQMQTYLYDKFQERIETFKKTNENIQQRGRDKDYKRVI